MSLLKKFRGKTQNIEELNWIQRQTLVDLDPTSVAEIRPTRLNRIYHQILIDLNQTSVGPTIQRHHRFSFYDYLFYLRHQPVIFDSTDINQTCFTILQNLFI